MDVVIGWLFVVVRSLRVVRERRKMQVLRRKMYYLEVSIKPCQVLSPDSNL